MGKSDAVTRTYMRENAVFADAVNYLIYNGKPVIKPENLREMDTAEVAVLSEKAGKKKNVKTITGIPMEINEEEADQDMCKAFEEMLEDSRNEGRNEGKLGILSQLIEQGLLTLETAAAQVNMTPEEFQKAITK